MSRAWIRLRDRDRCVRQSEAMERLPQKSLAAGAVGAPIAPLYLLLPAELAVGYAVAVAVLALIAAMCVVLRGYVFPTVNDGYDVARNRRRFKAGD